MTTGPQQVVASLPIVPDAGAWRAMSEEARVAFIVRCMDQLSEAALAMGEGRPHSTAKARVLDLLRQHYQRTNRLIYLAPDLMVLYPNEPPIDPDIIAVLGVPDPGENDTRLCWSVVDEGKGVDLVIEVLHRGNARKDLVQNVDRYARLGIREYFVYDRRKERVVGWRLDPASKGYRALAPTAGRLVSEVLDLDLAVIDAKLRFFQGSGELTDSASLIVEFSKMVDDNVAAFEAEQVAREQAEQERDSAVSERESAVRALRAAIRTVLRGRGLAIGADDEARLVAATAAQLDRWLSRALTASSTADALDDPAADAPPPR